MLHENFWTFDPSPAGFFAIIWAQHLALPGYEINYEHIFANVEILVCKFCQCIMSWSNKFISIYLFPVLDPSKYQVVLSAIVKLPVKAVTST